MSKQSFGDISCSIARTLDVVGQRWTALVLRDLFAGMTRFEDLRRDLGIASNVLAARLDDLERHAVVERRQYQSAPTRFEYILTDKGRDLWKVTTALREWGDRWNANGLGASTIEMVDGRSGRPVVLALVDAESGEPVPKEHARLRPGPIAAPGLRKLLGETP